MSFFGCFGGSKVLKSPKKIGKKDSSNNTRADRFKIALELIAVLKSLCLVLGVDFKFTLLAAHPGFDENMMSKNISKKAIKKLTSLKHMLLEIKIQRMNKLQELARNLIALWNLLNTPTEGQQSFHVVVWHATSSAHEITEPYVLSLDFLNDVEAEVSRLEELKSTKLEELVSKKKRELKKLRRCPQSKKKIAGNSMQTADLLLSTKPVHSAKKADDLSMPPSHGTVGCSNSKNVRSDGRKLEEEIPPTTPNSNNTNWTSVCEKEAEGKRLSLAPSNSNDDHNWVIACDKEREENKPPKRVTGQSPKCNWRLEEEEEEDDPFRDYF